MDVKFILGAAALSSVSLPNAAGAQGGKPRSKEHLAWKSVARRK